MDKFHKKLLDVLIFIYSLSLPVSIGLWFLLAYASERVANYASALFIIDFIAWVLYAISFIIIVIVVGNLAEEQGKNRFLWQTITVGIPIFGPIIIPNLLFNSFVKNQ